MENVPDHDPMLWDDVPFHLQGGLKRYFEEHVRPGGFLVAVLSNDLREAVTRGSRESLAGLGFVMAYLIACAPSECWGSAEAVNAWVGKRGAAGVEVPVEQ